MLVLCYGMPKSGCTPVFELVRAMLSLAGYPQETFINEERGGDKSGSDMRNVARNLTREKIGRMLSAIGADGKVVVKTHSRMPEGQFRWLEELHENGQLCVVASYRDPRAMCLSALTSAAKRKKGISSEVIDTIELRHVAANLQRRIPHFREWGALKGALRLDYDSVALLTDDAMDRIEATLNITCDRITAKREALETSHVNKTKSRQDRYEELSGSQNAEMMERFGEFLHQVCNLDNQEWFDAKRPGLLRAVSDRTSEPEE